MKKAEEGDLVALHYTLKKGDGKVEESSQEQEPLRFVIGEHKVMPCLEKGVVGMSLGERKTMEVQAEDAFGPYIKELVFEVHKERLPKGLELKPGMQMQREKEDGSMMTFLVIENTDEGVILDANHPLAGIDVVFDIELNDLLKTTAPQ